MMTSEDRELVDKILFERKVLIESRGREIIKWTLMERFMKVFFIVVGLSMGLAAISLGEGLLGFLGGMMYFGHYQLRWNVDTTRQIKY
jgi:hypothetical protein